MVGVLSMSVPTAAVKRTLLAAVIAYGAYVAALIRWANGQP